MNRPEQTYYESTGRRQICRRKRLTETLKRGSQELKGEQENAPIRHLENRSSRVGRTKPQSQYSLNFNWSIKRKTNSLSGSTDGLFVFKERPNIWSIKVETIGLLSKSLIFLAEEINACLLGRPVLIDERIYRLISIEWFEPIVKFQVVGQGNPAI